MRAVLQDRLSYYLMHPNQTADAEYQVTAFHDRKAGDSLLLDGLPHWFARFINRVLLKEIFLLSAKPHLLLWVGPGNIFVGRRKSLA
jgi:hypothetical protein